MEETLLSHFQRFLSCRHFSLLLCFVCSSPALLTLEGFLCCGVTSSFSSLCYHTLPHTGVNRTFLQVWCVFVCVSWLCGNGRGNGTSGQLTVIIFPSILPCTHTPFPNTHKDTHTPVPTGQASVLTQTHQNCQAEIFGEVVLFH